MSLRSEIATLCAMGRSAALVPFIGDAYETSSPGAFRVLVIGINSYISEKDWPKDPAKMRDWHRDWWGTAACEAGGSYAFYTKAFREASALGQALASSSSLFSKLSFDADPSTKTGLYATNAVKEYMRGDEFKDSKSITPEILAKYRETWHAELDALANHGVLPHLIVVLGEQVWDHAWQAFHGEHHRSKAFEVVEYETPGVFEDPIHHHANRLLLKAGDKTQQTLLVRFHHPSKWGPDQKRAEWILGEPNFRKLARLA